MALILQTRGTDLPLPPALPGQAGVESRAENHFPGGRRRTHEQREDSLDVDSFPHLPFAWDTFPHPLSFESAFPVLVSPGEILLSL